MSGERRVLVLGVAALLAALAAGSAAALLVLGRQSDQLRAIAFAAAVAGGGAVTGWIVARRGTGGPAAVAVAGGLAATLVRMLPLLVALAWLIGGESVPWKQTAAGLLVAFHLVLLAADIGLHAMLDPKPAGAAGDPKNRPTARVNGRN
jgi:hypothetical protein